MYIYILFLLATIIVMCIHIVSDCIRDAQQSKIKMVHIKQNHSDFITEFIGNIWCFAGKQIFIDIVC